MFRILPVAAFAVACGAANLCGAQESARTLVVLDGSGSMWGQIDGRPKLEIARETLAEVLTDLPPERELGLVAYGHRRKGDCSDIEVMVPPQPGAADTVRAAASRMRFLGKTPLVAATRQAAESLRYTEGPATLILVTDGLETCGGDLCALAAELEAAGVDFTAHVVGLGLTYEEGESLACLADQTGGLYLDAGNSKALNAALSKALDEGQAVSLPDAVLTTPATGGRGSTIAVGWSGPARPGDYIDVAQIDGPGAASLARIDATEPTGEGQLALPAELGRYVIRYMTPLSAEERIEGKTEQSLAVETIEVVDIDKFLTAPARVQQGRFFDVTWGGPGASKDFIAIFDPTYLSEVGVEGWEAQTALNSGNSVTLQAPLQPGAYEIHYIASGASDYASIISIPLEVLPFDGLLDAPEMVRPGDSFAVKWSGPAGDFDLVDMVLPATQGVHDYEDYEVFSSFYPTDVSDTREGVLTAPETEGSYELRYLASIPAHRGTGPDRIALVRKAITVSANAPQQESTDLSGIEDDAKGQEHQEGIGEDVSLLCEGDVPCALQDPHSGLTVTLPAGWFAAPPVENPETGLPLVAFFSTVNPADRVVLNPHSSDRADLSCLPAPKGVLCTTQTDESRHAFGLILRSLTLAN